MIKDQLVLIISVLFILGLAWVIYQFGGQTAVMIYFAVVLVGVVIQRYTRRKKN